MENDRINILLIEDVPTHLTVLKGMGGLEQINFFCAESGRDALELAREYSFALALVDMQMPGMDGFELVSQLKSCSKTRDIICIFVTETNKEPSYAVKGLKAGAVDYLYKPLDPWVTQAKVSIYLELYRQKQRLLEQNQRMQRYALQINNAADIIAVVNPVNMKFLEINPAVQEILGYEPERVLGTSILDYVHKEDVVDSQARFASFLKDYGTTFSSEVRFLTSHHDYVWLSVQIVNKMGYLFVNARDVTFEHNHIEQIIQAKEQAEKERMGKEQFLANMSHEIRTPMNGIIGLTRLLQESPLNEEQQETVGLILNSSHSLLNIINDILDLSKIESGKFQLEQIDFQPREVIKTVMSLLRPKADEKRIGLEEIIPHTVPQWVVGDPHRLNQVLVNLVGNAIKFTETGHVTIRLSGFTMPEGKTQLTFSVDDTGIGIPADKLNSIFENFSQASADTMRKFGGTGLGLTISRKLVEMQGGVMRVESQLGEGSTFSFILSYLESMNQSLTQAQAQANQHNPFELRGLEGRIALLADDNKVNRMVGGKTLRRWGMEVVFAEDGREAVEMAIETAFDVILMDIQMPDMDGYEASQVIRNTSNLNQETPIIALTANVVGNVVTQASEAGMDSVLTKPFDPMQLYENLTKMIEGGRPSAEVRPQLRHEMDSINIAYLRALSGGGDQFVLHYLRTFIDQVPQALADMQTAHQRGEYAHFLTVLGRVKQDFIYIDYEAAKELIHKLESITQDTPHALFAQWLHSLEDMVDAIIAKFEDLLEQEALIQAEGDHIEALNEGF
jgi:PAS domain S-box-containing protein